MRRRRLRVCLFLFRLDYLNSFAPFLDENGLSFIETSALDASNVESAFQSILTGTNILMNSCAFAHCILYRYLPHRLEQVARTVGGPDQAHHRRYHHRQPQRRRALEPGRQVLLDAIRSRASRSARVSPLLLVLDESGVRSWVVGRGRGRGEMMALRGGGAGRRTGESRGERRG